MIFDMDIYNKHNYHRKKDLEIINAFRYQTYFDLLFNILNNSFVYEGLPESINTDFLEGYLNIFGKVGFAKIDGELICGIGDYCGEVDFYGIGTDGLVTTCKGSKQAKLNTDVVIGKNNDTFQPEKLIYYIVHIIREIDKSIDCNVLFSRYIPIPIANDDKTKTAIDLVIQNLENGDTETVVSDNILAKELGLDGIQKLELNDVTKVDKLQYLSKMFDDILKRFFMFYGYNLKTINQGSQTNEDELHGSDTVSRLYQEVRLKHRQKMIDDLNKTFGLNASVRFNKALDNEVKKNDLEMEKAEKEVEVLENEINVDNDKENVDNDNNSNNNDNNPNENVDNDNKEESEDKKDE